MTIILDSAPFALSTDGRLLVNLTHFPGVRTLEDAITRAAEEHGDVFVGIALGIAEVDGVVRSRLENVAAEIAAFVVVGRQHR